jgi:nicotinate-nucleotide pyrophosphorylase (carboxylating)
MSTTGDVHPPMAAVRDAVARALAEDIGPLGDLTASLVPDVTVSARLVARAQGVLAGRRCADETFAQVDATLRTEWHLDDGADLAVDAVLADVEGPLPSILTAERTALNFLRHLSGVATATRRFVLAAGEGARVWDTRKTTPGLRALEKAAVRAGGGVNHRGSLSDFVLVKDNHLLGVTITDAVRRAQQRWPARTVEVECDRREQVEEALRAGADLVLLDNMTPAEVRTCVELVAGRMLVEVSGNVTLDTVAAYAATGADLISVGALTHSASALDISLDVVAKP